MKHIKTVILTSFLTLFAANAAFAHCGNCGTEEAIETENHAEHADSSHVKSVIDGYLSMQKALAADDLDATKMAASTLTESIHQEEMREVVSSIADAETLKAARTAFLKLSNHLIAVAPQFPESESLFLAHCPMAFENQGGSWIQGSDTLTNPYFGSMMLHCGTIKPLKNTADSTEKQQHHH